MKNRFLVAVIGSVLLVSNTARAAQAWLTDYDAALKQARAEDKILLINFTGSDWCGWCIRLKNEVFNTREFDDFARANMVLLEVDFPRRKPLPPEHAARNEALAAKFAVEGFPTIKLVKANGVTVGEGGYVQGGPKAFIAALRQTPGEAWKDGTRGSTGTAASAPSVGEIWKDIAAPPKRYEDLRLTGLSGPENRRLALINNQTFAAGESARVKLKGGEVKLLCKEIRNRSVIVQLDGSGTTQELFINTR